MKSVKTGRNDPCPCGSGKKYKHCCAGKADNSATQLAQWVLIGVVALALAAALGILRSSLRGGAGEAGDTAPGRVWSPEHGHWHNLGDAGRRPTEGFVPRPDGPAPPGKVWSPEHGHWHDAP